MTIHREIRAALETHLSNTSGLPPIVFENVSYNPDTNVSFLSTDFIPTLRRPAVRGSNPIQRYQGLFAVTVYSKEGDGPANADEIAEKVIQAFEATTDLQFTNSEDETITVSIDYAERQRGLLETPWYYIPINIGWYTYK